MSTTQLPKVEWQPFFDQISKNIQGNLAEIELNSLVLGNQIQTQWTPLFGISYDKRSDTIDVIAEDLDHRISNPEKVYVEQTGLTLTSMEIIGHDHISQIIKLRRPLSLGSFEAE